MLDALIDRVGRLQTQVTNNLVTPGWATVTSLAPLRIQLAGAPTPQPVTPSTIYQPNIIGERVFVLSAFRRVTVLGPAGGQAPQIIDDGALKGTCYRYPDGRQTCHLVANATIAIDKEYGSLHQNTWTWVFPAPFVEHPVITVGQMQWRSSASWGQALRSVGPPYSDVLLRLWDVQARAAGTTYIQATAEGRWR